jgi:hypothetical protein
MTKRLAGKTRWSPYTRSALPAAPKPPHEKNGEQLDERPEQEAIWKL